MGLRVALFQPSDDVILLQSSQSSAVPDEIWNTAIRRLGLGHSVEKKAGDGLDRLIQKKKVH